MAALQIQTELRWKENQPLRDLDSPPQAHCSPGNANRILTSLPLRCPWGKTVLATAVFRLNEVGNESDGPLDNQLTCRTAQGTVLSVQMD